MSTRRPSAQQRRPPSPALPQRKSGLPDLRKVKTRPGQARGAWGEQTESAARTDSISPERALAADGKAGSAAGGHAPVITAR
jgi:hypothetical protein